MIATRRFFWEVFESQACRTQPRRNRNENEENSQSGALGNLIKTETETAAVKTSTVILPNSNRLPTCPFPPIPLSTSCPRVGNLRWLLGCLKTHLHSIMGATSSATYTAQHFSLARANNLQCWPVRLSSRRCFPSLDASAYECTENRQLDFIFLQSGMAHQGWRYIWTCQTCRYCTREGSTFTFRRTGCFEHAGEMQRNSNEASD